MPWRVASGNGKRSFIAPLPGFGLAAVTIDEKGVECVFMLMASS